MPTATAADPTISTAGFTILPNYILLDPSLSIESKATLSLLRFFDRGQGRGCFCKKETLCHYLKISPYRLRQALRELEKRGLIKIQRRGQGQTDVIFVVYEEERDTPEPQPLQFEDIEDEMGIGNVDELEIDGIEEELGHVGKELEEVDSSVPGEKSADLEVKESEIQTCNDFTSKEQVFEEKKDNNTPCTKPGTTELLDTDHQEKQCEEDEIISYFYKIKENRHPTQNEIKNWASTARRLLSEFTLPELKEATKYAIDQGARLFYFLALVGPKYIIHRRQQQVAELQHAQIASKAIETQNERGRRLEALRSSAREFDAETHNLLASLEDRMRPQTFNVWFRNTFISNITDDTLTLAVASPEAAEWMSKSYTALIQAITGKDRIEFISLN